MGDFDYKKYLAEGKLLKEEMSFDDDIENKTNKNDFAFWYRSGARGKAQALKAQELLKQKGIDADYSKGPFYIDFSNAGVEERVIHQMLRDANLDRFVIMRDDKDLAEGTCGYSVDGEGGDKPAGSHLLKKDDLEESQGTLSSDMLNYADQYHMELVDTMKGVSTYPDKRTDGFYIKFPHFNGPGPGALFGKDVVNNIEASKAAAKAAAQKTVSKFQDSIEDYEISDSRSGVYGNVWLWIMPK